MTAIESILLNFSEIRRRSTLVWNGIPDDLAGQKTDPKALSLIEAIRHVLEGEHLFHTIIKNRGDLGEFISPWKGLEFNGIQNEIAFSAPYRAAFLEEVRAFTPDDLEQIRIRRKEVNQDRKLGDYLYRIAYHEAVHTGQLLAALRSLGAERPQIWD